MNRESTKFLPPECAPRFVRPSNDMVSVSPTPNETSLPSGSAATSEVSVGAAAVPTPASRVPSGSGEANVAGPDFCATDRIWVVANAGVTTTALSVTPSAVTDS